MPWIYDEGMALINRLDRTRLSSPPEKILSNFERLLMVSTKGRIAEMFFDDEENYFVFRELPHVILNNLQRLISKRI